MPRKKQVFKCYKCKRDTFRDNHNLLQHVNICAKTAVQEPDDEHLKDSREIVGYGPNLDRVEEMRDPGVAVHRDFPLDQVEETCDPVAVHFDNGQEEGALDPAVPSKSSVVPTKASKESEEILDPPHDFLSYLRSKFDDEEADAFFTSFALTLQ